MQPKNNNQIRTKTIIWSGKVVVQLFVFIGSVWQSDAQCCIAKFLLLCPVKKSAFRKTTMWKLVFDIVANGGNRNPTTTCVFFMSCRSCWFDVNLTHPDIQAAANPFYTSKYMQPFGPLWCRFRPSQQSCALSNYVRKTIENETEKCIFHS